MQGSGNQESWKERLRSIVDFPSKQRVSKFITEVGLPSFKSVKEELKALDIAAEVEQTEKGIRFYAEQGEAQGFSYEIRPKRHLQPEFANDDESTSESDSEYYRAEVHLGEGGQDYCVMGWSKTALINDVVDQYHKHLYFLHLMR
jgi:choline/glycine/proline betaine transport protein